MWMTTPYRHLGPADIGTITDLLTAMPESAWLEGENLRRSLTLYRETHSIFLKSVSAQLFGQILAERPLREADVEIQGQWGELVAETEALIQQIIQYLGVEGIVTRIQFARMKPGTKIQPHIDQSLMLVASHRVHIPLTSNAGVTFTIDDQNCHFEPGEVFELNNRVVHSVVNDGETDRIHLIVDYLPDTVNAPNILRPGFEKRAKQRLVTTASAPPAPRLELELPTVIATSVIRGAHKEESHGGVYLVDLQDESVQQVIDWDTCDISWEGRGWDRGLRGIAQYGDRIYIAASDELFCFDRSFKRVNSWKNPYLRHAHEIFLYQDTLLVTSTGFDSILQFDLGREEFNRGWLLRPREKNTLNLQIFDPRSSGPSAGNTLHLNNVTRDADGLYVSGRGLPMLLRINDGEFGPIAKLPPGTHNAMKFGDGVLYNDTNSDLLAFEAGSDFCYLEVPSYPDESLTHNELGDDKLARQAFGRGLCLFGDNIVIAGSSPSTITAWDMKAMAPLKSINLTMDVRNAIHGLEVWEPLL